MDPMEDRWAEILGELSSRMTRATFDTWLASSRIVGEDSGVLTVAVQHGLAVDWLQERMLPAILPVINRHLPGMSIKFVPGAKVVDTRRADDILEQPIMEAVREERVQVGGPAGTLVWTDFYIKLKVAFRRKALAQLKGAKLSCFLCLALHVDRDGVAKPGIETIVRETGYSRPSVCSALDELESLGLIQKSRSQYMSTDAYIVTGYAWFGKTPAPALWEEKSES